MNILYIIGTGVLFALNALFIKLSGTKISAFNGIVFWAMGAAIIGLGLFIFQKMRGDFTVSFEGGSYALIAGIFLSLGIILYLTAFMHGVDLSYATPIVNTIVVLLSVVLGVLFFGEAITWYRVLGISLAIISIYILSTS